MEGEGEKRRTSGDSGRGILHCATTLRAREIMRTRYAAARMSSPGASATERAEELLQWNLAYGFRRLSPVVASWPTTFPQPTPLPKNIENPKASSILKKRVMGISQVQNQGNG
jgi:hypothetical protein